MDFGPGSTRAAGNPLNVFEAFKVYGGQIHALEAFMNTIKMPADGNYDIDRMINAAVARGADADAISRGRGLFTTPGQCFRCHSGPVLADVDQSMIDQGLVIVIEFHAHRGQVVAPLLDGARSTDDRTYDFIA